MYATAPPLKPGCKCGRKHSWSDVGGSVDRCDAGDGAAEVVRGGWHAFLDAAVLAQTDAAAVADCRGSDSGDGDYDRRLERRSVVDLLRFFRFVHTAADQLSSSVAAVVGAAGGALPYFLQPNKFPTLFMFVYWCVSLCLASLLTTP